MDELLNDLVCTVGTFICIVVGICCGGQLHGRLHQRAGEAERL